MRRHGEDEASERIRVVLRARPLNQREGTDAKKVEEVVRQGPKNTGEVYVYEDKNNAISFQFDHFIAPEKSQRAAFEESGIIPMIDAAMDGYPGTVFAYGMTGAGKTFSIFGKEKRGNSQIEFAPEGSSTDGLLPRTATYIMNRIQNEQEEKSYRLRITCAEIYNDQVRDLFDMSKEMLQVRHSAAHGFYLEDITVVECRTHVDFLKIIWLAAKNRTVSAHRMNTRSNRSHCLFTIYIDTMSAENQESGGRYGKLSILDLAGSERVRDTNSSGQTLQEAGHINKSLYALSKVIHALNSSRLKGKRKPRSTTPHIPYRDCKLTMLLESSLGGNSKTMLLACVTPSLSHRDETLRTLQFAMGVAKISNRPVALLKPHEKLIMSLKAQIKQLQAENQMLRAMNGADGREALNPTGDTFEYAEAVGVDKEMVDEIFPRVHTAVHAPKLKAKSIPKNTKKRRQKKKHKSSVNWSLPRIQPSKEQAIMNAYGQSSSSLSRTRNKSRQKQKSKLLAPSLNLPLKQLQDIRIESADDEESPEQQLQKMLGTLVSEDINFTAKELSTQLPASLSSASKPISASSKEEAEKAQELYQQLCGV